VQLPPAPSDDPNLVGPIPPQTQLDERILVVAQIGAGAMGYVYRGFDLALEREVAVKILHPRFRDNADLMQRFVAEARALAQLRSEQIVQIFSFGSFDGLPYFVMEFFSRSIEDLLRTTTHAGDRLEDAVVLGILRQASRGLTTIHEQGLVHRDVKPSNMLMDARVRVVIADFGVAETIDSQQRGLCGTPTYLAPELLAQNPNALPSALRNRADLYALATSAYELLTGRPPFAGRSLASLLKAHKAEDPPPASAFRDDLPPAVDAALSRGLAKDPRQRHESCAAFVEALERGLAGAPAVNPTALLPLRRVLIIDGDAEHAALLHGALSVGIKALRVHVARDGEFGLMLVRTLRPDLVICELALPAVNGIELIATLRAEEPTADLPVVVVSSHLGDAEAAILDYFGVSEQVNKPVVLQRLVQTIERVLPSGPRVPLTTTEQSVL
jgi:CheY-like chemotaxis protein